MNKTTITRACPLCDKEKGTIRNKENLVSHGYCKRHAYDVFPPSMHAKLDSFPENYFVPEVADKQEVTKKMN